MVQDGVYQEGYIPTMVGGTIPSMSPSHTPREASLPCMIPSLLPTQEASLPCMILSLYPPREAYLCIYPPYTHHGRHTGVYTTLYPPWEVTLGYTPPYTPWEATPWAIHHHYTPWEATLGYTHLRVLKGIAGYIPPGYTLGSERG